MFRKSLKLEVGDLIRGNKSYILNRVEEVGTWGIVRRNLENGHVYYTDQKALDEYFELVTDPVMRLLYA